MLQLTIAHYDQKSEFADECGKENGSALTKRILFNLNDLVSACFVYLGDSNLHLQIMVDPLASVNLNSLTFSGPRPS